VGRLPGVPQPTSSAVSTSGPSVRATVTPVWMVSALFVLNTGAVMLFQGRTACVQGDGHGVGHARCSLASATASTRCGGSTIRPSRGGAGPSVLDAVLSYATCPGAIPWRAPTGCRS
jgi:hypothetical protein